MERRPDACPFSRHSRGLLFLHGVNYGYRLGLLRVVRLEVDLEVRHGHAEHLEQRSLVAVHDLSLLAHGVGRIQCDLTLVQPGGHAPFPDRGLDAVGERDILLSRHLTTSRVNDASGDRERLCGSDTSARKVRLRVRREVLEDVGGLAVCEEKTDVASEVLGELGEVGEVLFSWRNAEGFGHDFGLTKEESAQMLL